MNRHERRRAARQDELVTDDGAIVAFKHILKMEFMDHAGETVLAVGGVGQDDKSLTVVLATDQLGMIIDKVGAEAKRRSGANDNGGAAGVH